MDTDRAIHVDGNRLVDGTGATVLLRGFGLGGWMTMENFITGHPATEGQLRRALGRSMGAEASDAFFDAFLTDFFGEADADFLVSLGVNALRVPFSYHHLEDDAAPFQLKEEGFARLDRVVRSEE